MDQRQEKASENLGRAISEVVQSGLYGAAEATHAHAFINGEPTNFMVVIFAQAPEAAAAIKERALTAMPHECAAIDTEHRGMAGLADMLTQQSGGKPFVFDNGPSYNQFVVGPSGSGMTHTAAAEIVKSNCVIVEKLQLSPSQRGEN